MSEIRHQMLLLEGSYRPLISCCSLENAPIRVLKGVLLYLTFLFSGEP